MYITRLYAPIVGLSIALAITTPCSAEEQDTSRKLYPSAQPVAVKAAPASRKLETTPRQERATEAKSTQSKADTSDPTITPYVTYDGAATSNTDR